MRRLAWLALAALLVAPHLLAPHAARAQDAATRARAGEHFDRGIAFFNEQRYDAALAELARAHELAPAPPTLYNLARVHAALGHAVEAARDYDRYLREAGDTIDARRRAEVEAALAAQRSRIGHLRVETDVVGATVSIDGVDVATTPLPEPIALSAGTHTVEVRAPGREAVRRAVAIAGETSSSLSVSLREEVIPRGTLRVEAALPDVEIEVDGTSVGLTPLNATLPLRAGDYTVRATRPGYLPDERRVAIEEGAEALVRFDLRRDPAAPAEHIGSVRLQLPDAPHLLRVDGEAMVGETLELPVGTHRITLEVTDRQPYEGTLRVPAGSIVVITPPLAWTLDAREGRLTAARTQRSAGIALTVVGGAVLVAGVSLLGWNEAEIVRTDARLLVINEELDRCRDFPTPLCDTRRIEGAELAAQQDTQNILRAVSIASSVVGFGLTVTGVGLWIAAPGDEEVDSSARARARLEVGPGNLSVRGWF